MTQKPMPTSIGGRQKGALHNETTRRLREMIVSGELAPGERLREAHYCKVFDVSRTPFREALKTLAAEGLVELLPNRSSIVSDVRDQDLLHLYQVVASLEALAGRLACQTITPSELAEIVEIHSRMLGCYERGERVGYLKLNHRIHRRVVEIAGNPILLSNWLGLIPNVERARALANLDNHRWLAAVSEHSKMLSALAAHDGDELAALTEAHFMNGLSYAQKHSKAMALED